ncbi:CRISPR-associated endonuclease Cas1 [Salinibacter sp.]|uniref:CRISPR-associated endonuclease Cas1 n=1 Tax=Salinibacter sp. TaxID=2065818 RepID=UPI0021E75039|nr:CRISPR-associated endonuclease Cas1 [Salinibacter sp.]
MSTSSPQGDTVPDPSDTRIVPSAAPARTLYVDTIGATVRRQRERLLVQESTDQGRKTLAAHPACDLDSVILVGQGAHCTTPALRFCLSRDLTVLLLSRHGKVQGYLSPPSSTKRVDVRQAQYAATRRPESRVLCARAWVGAKLHNMQRRLYRRACRNTCPALERALESFDALERRHMRADSLDVLRGLEGAATRAYFQAWPALIQREEPTFNFDGRNRRPPGDAVNALLGFTYALLQKDVRAACATAGIDPSLGLLHSPRSGCPAAVLDLMEPFRPALADSVVLSLINRRAVAPEHFESRDRGIYLNKSGRTAVYKAYGSRRTDTVTPPDYNRSLPYVRVLELQARRLAEALTEETDFTAFRL